MCKSWTGHKLVDLGHALGNVGVDTALVHIHSPVQVFLNFHSLPDLFISGMYNNFSDFLNFTLATFGQS